MLLLQTFSHVAGIQLKVLEAGDRSSQVGYDRWLGSFGRLLPRVEDAERERSPLTELCVIKTQRKGWIEGQIVLGILVCLLVWELTEKLHKTILPMGLERETERIRSGSKKKGLGEKEVEDEERKI